MSAGRKPQKPMLIEAVDAALDQSKIIDATAQMRADGIAEKVAHNTAIFDLGRQVGAIQLARMQRDFLRAAEIRLFEEIKETKKYKDLALPDADGNLRTAEDLAGFCKLVFGISYSVMAEESQNLRLLGDSAYDTANRLGMNRKQLRLIRSLPDEQIAAVQDAIASESKAEVIAVIEDLAAKLAESAETIAEHEAEAQASSELLSKKNAQLDQKTKELKRIKAQSPDEALAGLQKEATALMNDAVGCIRGQLRNAFLALSQHHETTGEGDSDLFMAGMAGQLQADLTALREEFNLPDISNAAAAQLAAERGEWDKAA